MRDEGDMKRDEIVERDGSSFRQAPFNMNTSLALRRLASGWLYHIFFAFLISSYPECNCFEWLSRWVKS